MKLCPICHRCYDDSDTLCPNDQTALVASRPGTRMIAEKYRLDRMLGRGGMGAVYAGTHVDLDRPVAIKLLLSDFTADPDALERFRREARAAARLNHPNVADTYDYGVLPDGGAYIVMEMIEGQTLREFMDAADRLSIAEAVEIAGQVAHGIDVAHRSGIVHRDLKPSNIILSRDHHGGMQAKVVDFGVAKLKEHSTTGGGLTASGSLIGTPRYMSPEQCSGHQTDGRSDIYSMGVILYEMLAGRPPFDAPTPTAIAVKHIQQPPPSLKEVRADVPAELDRFLCQVMDKDPEKRPQSAAEFAQKLSEAARAAIFSETPSDELSERPEKFPEAVKSAAGRETNAFTTQARTTQRSVGPTLEHSSPTSEREDDPSVQGFAQPIEALAETQTKVAEPIAQPDITVESEPVIPAVVRSPMTTEIERDVVSEDRRLIPRRSLVLFAAAVFALGFIVVAIWLTKNRSSQETAGMNSSSRETPTAGNSPATSPSPDSANTANRNALPPRDARAELATSLNEWISATNSRDLDKQMTFYAPTLNVFYLKRNAAKASVRAEKGRVLAQATSVDVRISEPQIEVAPDGQTATMRFRKSWNFSGVSPESGEVIQELRWRKLDSGWKIVGERDVEVIRLVR